MTTLDALSHPALRHLAPRLRAAGSAPAGMLETGPLLDVLAEVVRIAGREGADAELRRIGAGAGRVMPALRALHEASAGGRAVGGTELSLGRVAGHGFYGTGRGPKGGGTCEGTGARAGGRSRGV